MRTFKLCVLLLVAFLALVCSVHALDDIPAPMQQLPTDPTEDRADKPKLFRPNKGFHKEDHERDRGERRGKPEGGQLDRRSEVGCWVLLLCKRVLISSYNSADDLLAMLHAVNGGRRRDEL